jgi:flagellar motor switch protein FliN
VSWETLTWRPADATNPEGIGPLLSETETIKSALEEAVAAAVMGPVTISALDVADIGGPSDLPDGFTTVATFELLGKGRLPLAVALDPSGGDRLAGTVFDVTVLGRRLAEELDAVVGFIAGEGLQVGPGDNARFPDGERLVLLRLTLTDAEGGEARVVAAVDSDAPSDLGMHLILLKEMGKITLEPPSSEPKPTAAPDAAAPGPAPVASPAQEPVPVAAAGLTAAAPTAFAQAPAAYPAMPALAGAAPAGFGTSAYPPNVRPFTLDELGGSTVAGHGTSLDLLYGVNLEVTVEIGRTHLPIRDVLALTPGSIVELDKLAGEKVDVLVNGHLIASGEVVVVDENFGVRITEVSARAQRIAMAEGAA